MVLNEDVALALGQERCDWPTSCPNSKSVNHYPGSWVRPLGGPASGEHWKTPPDYEHDIKAAMTLLHEDWATVTMKRTGEGWQVAVWFMLKQSFGFAKELPEAICRAFLATREESK